MNPRFLYKETESSMNMIKTIKSKFMIDLYKKHSDIDVSKYFYDVDEIQIREDVESGYRFYYPLSLAGDEGFYQELSNNDFSYMPWKWEYTEALNHISIVDSALEIGCGNGVFVKKLEQNGNNDTDIELNGDQVNKLITENNNGCNELLSEHANRSLSYDVIISSQVIEHIADINDYFTKCIRLLNTGGEIIFCVPNIDSFIKYNHEFALNMPPHHKGLRSEKAIQSTENFTQLKLEIYY